MLPQPDRSLGGVLVRGFLFFAVAYVAAFAAAWAVAGVWRANASIRDGSSLETAAYAAYVLFVTAVPTAFGFALVTSVWPFFRALSARQVAWLAAGGGIATYLAQATGVVWLLLALPLPAFLGSIGTALRMLVPGVAAGVVALLAARWLRPAEDRAPSEATRP